MTANVGNAPAASYEYFDRLEYDSGRFFIRPHLLTFAAFTSSWLWFFRVLRATVSLSGTRRRPLLQPKRGSSF